MNHFGPNDFESRIKASLQASVDQLDPNTKDKLYAIRRAALSTQHQGQGARFAWLKSHLWMSTAGLALGSLFVAMVMLPQLKGTHDDNQMVSDQTAMVELMENPEDADTLSDPGFYLWLDETQNEHAHEQNHAV
jgi:hypothetical protein